MLPISEYMNSYQDKKRKLAYKYLVKSIDEENKNNPTQPPKEIIGSKL